ncbi:hypothetical protein KUTeg_015499 [Tegillarca granosa]|uniref:Uncharacterized protein n=1 Tax=Tegillarca granosa TaxID=220873 RepID=A0ABQ9EQH7_TEGGR|nr:hypothetical protein KUTeg_015499 [Tegillarca granosa]
MYDSSPVKAEDLPTSVQPYISDPRPENTVEWKETSKDLSMEYRYKRADIQTATLDHNYLGEHFTEYWVDESLKVTERGVREIEEATRKQARSKRWHEEREWRITVSRFGDVCSATKRRNINKLCSSLVGQRKLNNSAIIHGLEYEGMAIANVFLTERLRINIANNFFDNILCC